ncbi:putative catechol oxidase [Helianthus debilis subsp. tardiflorus]
MYTQMIGTTTTHSDACFGTNPDPDPSKILAGRIESGVHTAVHIWVGNPRMPNNEDLGNFYSAG